MIQNSNPTSNVISSPAKTVKLPPGMTDDQVATIIYKVVNMLARKFRFGYHSVEDMKQEGARFACEALAGGHYDPSRPLENFLFTHIRNRFINYKRDNYGRNDPPCKGCIFFDPHNKKSTNQCAAFEDKRECKKLFDWSARSAAKHSIMSPNDIAIVSESPEEDTGAFDDASFGELRDLVDLHLTVDLRGDYLRMLDGVSIPKGRRLKVREAILKILSRNRNEDNDD